MYLIKTLEDLEPLLDDITVKEGEVLDEACINAWNEERSKRGYSGYLEDEDKLILPVSGGRWFETDIKLPLLIYGSNPISWMAVTKIKPEDREKVKNTVAYVMEHFDQIYENMLKGLLPTLKGWEMQCRSTGEYVETIEQLHAARDKRLGEEYFETESALREAIQKEKRKAQNTKKESRPETGCLNMIQLNCEYQDEDTVYYSMGFMPDCYEYGYDDGIEVVFCKDRVVSFTDGNTMEHIYDFKKYPGMELEEVSE